MFNQSACWVTPQSTIYRYISQVSKTKLKQKVTEDNLQLCKNFMISACDYLDFYCKGLNFKDIPWGACAVCCSNPAHIFLWSFGRRKTDSLIIRNPHKPLGFTCICYWMNMIKAKSNQNVIWFLGKLHFDYTQSCVR